MGEVNNYMCDYLGLAKYNADFWNGTVFHGKRKIKMWQLQRHDREYYKKSNQKKSESVRRDVQMHFRGKKNMILGVEVMDTVDYTIPIRIMDYNVQELRRQIRDIKHKRAMDETLKSGEFLYGLKKQDKLVPIHTIALYCGKEEYDGATGVIGLLDTEGMDAECQRLLKDYPVKISDMKNLREENYETSLREIIAVFKRSKDKDAMKAYYLEHVERFRELDDISIETMGALIGHKKLKMFRQKGGGLDMCKAFEDERAEGALEMLCSLVKDGILKLEEAAKRVNMSEENFRKKMQENGI